ncbi:MAG: hypothetical protein V3T35_04885 [Spirochaetia bacterium]|jgi:hypothetical protein
MEHKMARGNTRRDLNSGSLSVTLLFFLLLFGRIIYAQEAPSTFEFNIAYGYHEQAEGLPLEPRSDVAATEEYRERVYQYLNGTYDLTFVGETR